MISKNLLRSLNRPLFKRFIISDILQLNSFSTYSFLKTRKGVSGKPFGLYEFPESQADIEISTKEWQFVERLIPPKSIPKPTAPPGTVMPSGYVIPSASKDDYKYFVKRNFNHMLRVYHKHVPMTNRIQTIVRGIEGDIFGLCEELKLYLLEKSEKKMITIRVVEPHGTLIIKGDFVAMVKRFIVDKGF